MLDIKTYWYISYGSCLLNAWTICHSAKHTIDRSCLEFWRYGKASKTKFSWVHASINVTIQTCQFWYIDCMRACIVYTSSSNKSITLIMLIGTYVSTDANHIQYYPKVARHGRNWGTLYVVDESCRTSATF